MFGRQILWKKNLRFLKIFIKKKFWLKFSLSCLIVSLQQFPEILDIISFFVVGKFLRNYYRQFPHLKLPFTNCYINKKFVDIAKWLCRLPTFLEVVEHKMANMNWVLSYYPVLLLKNSQNDWIHLFIKE